MKIVFLDAKTIGDDIDLSGYDALGEVVKYGFIYDYEFINYLLENIQRSRR